MSRSRKRATANVQKMESAPVSSPISPYPKASYLLTLFAILNFFKLLAIGALAMGQFFLDDHFLISQVKNGTPLSQIFWFTTAPEIHAWFNEPVGSQFVRPLTGYTHGFDQALGLTYFGSLVHTLLYVLGAQLILIRVCARTLAERPFWELIILGSLFLLDSTTVSYIWIAQRSHAISLFLGTLLWILVFVQDRGIRGRPALLLVVAGLLTLTSELGFVLALGAMASEIWISKDNRRVQTLKATAFLAIVSAYLSYRSTLAAGYSSLYISPGDLLSGDWGLRWNFCKTLALHFLGLGISPITDLPFLGVAPGYLTVISLVGWIGFILTSYGIFQTRDKRLVAFFASIILILLALSLRITSSRNMTVPQHFFYLLLAAVTFRYFKTRSIPRLLVFFCSLYLLSNIVISYLRADGWARQRRIANNVTELLERSVQDKRIPIFLWTHDLWFVSTSLIQLQEESRTIKEVFVLSEAMEAPQVQLIQSPGSCLIQISSEHFFKNAANYREVIPPGKTLIDANIPFAKSHLEWAHGQLKSIQLLLDKTMLPHIRFIQAHDASQIVYRSWTLNDDCLQQVDH